MATSSNTGARKPATTKKTTPTRKTASAATTTSTQPKTAVEQVQDLAERVVLVPVGAGLLVRDDVVSTVKGLANKYSTRTNLERELKRYERRGVTARNRLERQVRKTRTRFERELRQRRTRVERTVKQNRRRLEREVRSVRRDFEKQSGQLSKRVEKIVSDVQEILPVS
jgi:DNA anti-recombination protein RmuC